MKPEDEWKMRYLWYRMEKNHPVLYEVIQWGLLTLAVAALFVSIAALLR